MEKPEGKGDPSAPNLYLVGFMGVGKSTIGWAVARMLGSWFIDSDKAIEEASGMTIPEIFEQFGEEKFRELEYAFAAGGHPERGCVVSCGGGILTNPATEALLKKKGIVVCLFASADTIYSRTQHKTHRPLLNTENPLEKIHELMERREPLYMKAGPGVTTENRTVKEIAKHVVRIYRREVAERSSEFS